MDMIAQEIAPGVFAAANHWCSVFTSDPLMHDDLGLPEGQLATIHACKHPCWLNAISEDGVPESYLVYEKGDELYLNMVDPPVPLFQDALFVRASLFIDNKLQEGKKVIVHCSQGLSRSPSLVLVHMARSGQLPIASYDAARKEFEKRYSAYSPGEGIQTFLRNRWENLTHVWPEADSPASA